VPIEPLRSDALFRPNRDVLADAAQLGADLSEAESIDGLIHPREGLLLYILARRAASLGNIVEIGAYKGRSTWYLARGLADARSPFKVISIDPHEAPEQRNAYFETIRRHDLAPHVEPVVGYSHDVAASFQVQPVGLLWIDGDHAYSSVRRDFDDWFPLLTTGGWYAMHDTVNAWYGPSRLAREILGRRADLDDVGVVWLTLFGRKEEASLGARLRGVRARIAFELLTLAQSRRSGFGPQAEVPGERRRGLRLRRGGAGSPSRSS
jgi:predicted O-methyltransferase YrrM